MTGFARAAQSNRAGILLMTAAVAAFAVQDGFSRHLAETYNVPMIIMIRYWIFLGFVLILAQRRPGGLRAVSRTVQPWLHAARAALLIAEICVIVWGYTFIGLIESHAVFAICPLLVAALSGPVLGERVGWRRWLAIGIGCLGVLVILQPGSGVFTPAALLPLSAALMFALYSLLTRKASERETGFASLFWAALIGAGLMTVIGLPFWVPMTAADWGLTILYSGAAITGHWLLIRCYEVAEAGAVQPFAYLQIPFVSAVGILVYDETLRPGMVLGVALVIAAGVYTLRRTAAVATAAKGPRS